MSDAAPRRRMSARGRELRPPRGVSAERVRTALEARTRGDTADVIETRLRAAGMPHEQAAALADHADLVHATRRAIARQRRRALIEIGLGLVLLVGGLALFWAWRDDLAGRGRPLEYVYGGGGALLLWGLRRLVWPTPRGFAADLTR